MEAELQERVQSSQMQATHVVEIYNCLKSTVDQLKADMDSGVGELTKETWDNSTGQHIFTKSFIERSK